MHELDETQKEKDMNQLNPYKKIIDLLNDVKVPFSVLEHDSMYTSQQEEELTGLEVGQGIKSILLKNKDDFLLALLPGDRRIDTKKVKTILSTKNLRFATPEEVEKIMFCSIGACYPFGSLIGLKTIMDPSLSENRVIAFNPGVHNKSIIMEYSDFYKIDTPEIRDIAQ